MLDAIFPRDGSPSNPEEIGRLTAKDKSASYYMFVMGVLESATGDFIDHDFPKQTDNAAIRLSEAALWIAQWLSCDAETLLHDLKKIADANSDRGRRAAQALHSRVGGSHDKQQSSRNAWASGKYSSRDLCAEQECAALNMAFGTARRALRNTAEPPRRCTA